jgi:hypothetical protein
MRLVSTRENKREGDKERSQETVEAIERRKKQKKACIHKKSM